MLYSFHHPFISYIFLRASFCHVASLCERGRSLVVVGGGADVRRQLLCSYVCPKAFFLGASYAFIDLGSLGREHLEV
jgi:hypothetical protein